MPLPCSLDRAIHCIAVDHHFFMRSSCSHGVRSRAGRMSKLPRNYVSTCPTAPSRLCHLRSKNSSSASGKVWSGCSHAKQQTSDTFRCRSAASDSSERDFGPQTSPAGSRREGKSSNWGSGWSKRSSSGSVFKKQPLKGKLDQQQHNGGSSESSSAAVAGSAAEQIDPQLEASIRMNVERANQTLQDIVQVRIATSSNMRIISSMTQQQQVSFSCTLTRPVRQQQGVLQEGVEYQPASRLEVQQPWVVFHFRCMVCQAPISAQASHCQFNQH